MVSKISLYLAFASCGLGEGLVITPGSTLTGTSWRLKLDVGREPGTWMPNDWATMGARLALSMDIEFTDGQLMGDPRQGLGLQENLVGPASSTKKINVKGGPASFVSERGREEVAFLGGGWCVQQPFDTPGAEALLRGWVDCISGAKRKDVSIESGERIFFTTGIWTDEANFKQLENDRKIIEKDIARIKNEFASLSSKGEGTGEAMDFFSKTFHAATQLRSKTAKYDEYQKLKFKLDELARMLPEPGKLAVANGISIAPRGGLCVKRKKLLGEEYHILGKMSFAPIAET
mmetsp:Transcript_48740/g.110616  ORF Transcript_48740/g.110616 Transcript_48740/m.110616 type:complete len:290 (-) Transcript_48740:312-1181(-)